MPWCGCLCPTHDYTSTTTSPKKSAVSNIDLKNVAVEMETAPSSAPEYKPNFTPRMFADRPDPTMRAFTRQRTNDAMLTSLRRTSDAAASEGGSLRTNHEGSVPAAAESTIAAHTSVPATAPSPSPDSATPVAAPAAERAAETAEAAAG